MIFSHTKNTHTLWTPLCFVNAVYECNLHCGLKHPFCSWDWIPSGQTMAEKLWQSGQVPLTLNGSFLMEKWVFYQQDHWFRLSLYTKADEGGSWSLPIPSLQYMSTQGTQSVLRSDHSLRKSRSKIAKPRRAAWPKDSDHTQDLQGWWNQLRGIVFKCFLFFIYL